MSDEYSVGLPERWNDFGSSFGSYSAASCVVSVKHSDTTTIEKLSITGRKLLVDYEMYLSVITLKFLDG